MNVYLFSIMVFWHTHNRIRTINPNFGKSRETKMWFAEEQLFQKKVLFSDFLTEPCIVFKGGFEVAKILSFIIS